MVVGWGSRARASLIVPIIADVDPKQTKEEYARIGDGIANSSNPNMLYGIWPGGMGKSWKWSAEVGGHYWRTANDSEFEVINPRALAHVTPTRRQERGDRGETAGRERARPHMGDKEVRERARARKWRKCARVLEQCERQRERERERALYEDQSFWSTSCPVFVKSSAATGWLIPTRSRWHPQSKMSGTVTWPKWSAESCTTSTPRCQSQTSRHRRCILDSGLILAVAPRISRAPHRRPPTPHGMLASASTCTTS